MRKIPIAAIVVLMSSVWTAAPARAQAAAPADTQTVNACLKKSANSGEFGGNCIGIVADPCIKTASKTNSYIDDSKKCAARELAVWTALSTEALRRANPAIEAKKKAALADSQKSFAQSRDTLCPIFDNVDPDMALGGSLYCRLQETARHALLLRRLADAVNVH